MRHCLILFAAALLSACYDKPVPSSDVCAIGVFAAPVTLPGRHHERALTDTGTTPHSECWETTRDACLSREP